MLLGRGHAALGQHSLSVSALEAALGLTKVGEEWTYLLLSFLVIRERASAGIAAALTPLLRRHPGERCGKAGPPCSEARKDLPALS